MNHADVWYIKCIQEKGTKSQNKLETETEESSVQTAYMLKFRESKIMTDYKSRIKICLNQEKRQIS